MGVRSPQARAHVGVVAALAAYQAVWLGSPRWGSLSGPGSYFPLGCRSNKWLVYCILLPAGELTIHREGPADDSKPPQPRKLINRPAFPDQSASDKEDKKRLMELVVKECPQVPTQGICCNKSTCVFGLPNGQPLQSHIGEGHD